jgi:hypothetical protein
VIIGLVQYNRTIEVVRLSWKDIKVQQEKLFVVLGKGREEKNSPTLSQTKDFDVLSNVYHSSTEGSICLI